MAKLHPLSGLLHILHGAEGHHHVDQRQDQGLKRPQGPWRCAKKRCWKDLERCGNSRGYSYIPLMDNNGDIILQ